MNTTEKAALVNKLIFQYIGLDKLPSGTKTVAVLPLTEYGFTEPYGLNIFFYNRDGVLIGKEYCSTVLTKSIVKIEVDFLDPVIQNQVGNKVTNLAVESKLAQFQAELDKIDEEIVNLQARKKLIKAEIKGLKSLTN